MLRSKAFSSIAILAALLLNLAACSLTDAEQEQPLEAGVSKGLALQRKAVMDSIEYELFFNIPENSTERIRGQERISLQLDSVAHDLVLDFKDTTSEISSLRVNGETSPVERREEHIIISRSLLRKGGNSISIHFMAGELSLNRNDEYLYSLLVPDRARSFFPCFDQPDLKAVFKLSLEIPSRWEAVSNGKVTAASDSGGRRKLVFAPSDPISTYLFSIVAGKFSKETRTIGSREMNFFHRETDSAKISESLDTIFQLHDAAVRFLEEYTGIAYPFQKLDFIAIKDFQFGGMEHAGAIDYRSSILFLDKKALPVERLDRAQTIAHEVSHMWFGNLVTMKWFDDVWMKEVFANFIADKVVRRLMPDGLEQMRFVLSSHPCAYRVDRTSGSNPIRQPLANLDQAGSLYGNIIYCKAPVVMAQLEEQLGENRLREGLRKYLERYSFSNADWPDLVKILDEMSEEDIAEWNEQWVNKPGRPVVSYSMKSDDGRITRLSVLQRSGLDSPGNWPQRISISLVYRDSIHAIPAAINGAESLIAEAEGLPVPVFILFNSSGKEYGSFPADTQMMAHISLLKDPLLRGTAYINIYEQVLEGEEIGPEAFLGFCSRQFQVENEPLILSMMAVQVQNIFWQFLDTSDRQRVAAAIEPGIWRAIASAKNPAKKKTLLRLLSSIAVGNSSAEHIYAIWDSTDLALRIPLNEEDYTALAYELAVRFPAREDYIFKRQIGRMKDSTAREKYRFIRPALSPDAAVRDAFFSFLLNEENRRKKTWVLAGLQYLHHPLRNNWGIKYLRPALEELEEIRKTGDIFFPAEWLRASLNYYQAREAADIIRSFLSDHPGYNQRLRLKILQEADDLFRVDRMRGGQAGV